MSKKIKGYLATKNQKYPIGTKILLRDIYGKELHTGDTIELKSVKYKILENVIFTKKGQIIGSCVGVLNPKNIEKWNVIKTRSYKDLKNNEKINGFKVVLEENNL